MAKYKQYDDQGKPSNGIYADMFEEEYNAILSNMQLALGDDEYMHYLDTMSANNTHSGYFSIDKNTKSGKEKLVDRKLERGTTEASDSEAYDLIMKNKERLLNRKEPPRFIFSH